MLTYIAKRLLGFIPMILGITLISFVVIHLAPGKPTDLQTQLNPKVSLEVRERLEKLYGLDKPVIVQYLNWVKRIFKFDFGDSYLDGRPVSVKIIERLPITLAIEILSLLLIFAIGIPIGVSAALREGSVYDHLMTVFVFIGFSLPTFWLALVLMDFFGVKLGVVAVCGIRSLDFDKFTFLEKTVDIIRHLSLPIFISAFGGLAGISRYMRSNMIYALRQDYVRTARAKGLPENRVVYVHALRNALLPIITILGLSLPGLIGGSVIFEQIFSIPGMGKLFFDGVMSRDYPLIMGILVIGAMLTLLGNFLADLSYALVDPRIRYIKEDG